MTHFNYCRMCGKAGLADIAEDICRECQAEIDDIHEDEVWTNKEESE